MNDLTAKKEICLIRCDNGWIARDNNGDLACERAFVFESTESLARNLVRLLGKSGWKIERDEKGHFKKCSQ